MVAPGKAEPIPICEGIAECRAGYYGRSRADRARLVSIVRGLQRYAHLVTGK